MDDQIGEPKEGHDQGNHERSDRHMRKGLDDWQRVEWELLMSGWMSRSKWMVSIEKIQIWVDGGAEAEKQRKTEHEDVIHDPKWSP